MTKAQLAALQQIRDGGRPWYGRHFVTMNRRLERLGLIDRREYPTCSIPVLTDAGCAALAAAEPPAHSRPDEGRPR